MISNERSKTEHPHSWLLVLVVSLSKQPPKYLLPLSRIGIALASMQLFIGPCPTKSTFTYKWIDGSLTKLCKNIGVVFYRTLGSRKNLRRKTRRVPVSELEGWHKVLKIGTFSYATNIVSLLLLRHVSFPIYTSRKDIVLFVWNLLFVFCSSTPILECS